MEKEQKLKKFHITITKSQAKAVSKAGDLEFIGVCQPFNVKILNFKPYKDSNRARLTLGYSRVRDLVQFMYVVGYLEYMLDSNDK